MDPPPPPATVRCGKDKHERGAERRLMCNETTQLQAGTGLCVLDVEQKLGPWRPPTPCAVGGGARAPLPSRGEVVIYPYFYRTVPYNRTERQRDSNSYLACGPVSR